MAVSLADSGASTNTRYNGGDVVVVTPEDVVVDVVDVDVVALGAAVVVVVDPPRRGRRVVVLVVGPLGAGASVVVEHGGRTARGGVVPSGSPATTVPDQKLVSPRAPAHESEMCM